MIEKIVSFVQPYNILSIINRVF